MHDYNFKLRSIDGIPELEFAKQALDFSFWVNLLGRTFCKLLLIHDYLVAILYSRNVKVNSKDLLWGSSCHHCMYFYSGIVSINRTLNFILFNRSTCLS